MTLLDDNDLPEPAARGAKRAPQRQAAPVNRRAEMRKAFFKFAVGCILTLIMGGIFLKFSILTTSAAVIAVAVQITAFVIYFTTSDIMTGYHVTPEKQAKRDVIGPERRAARRKTGLRFVTGLMLAFLAVMSFQRYGVLGYPLPWKITSPSSKLFNPHKFRFTDYRTRAEIDLVARTLFPVGTPKAAVDAILHDAGHASVKLYDTGISSKTFCYTYSSSASRGFLTGVVAWVLNNPEADKLWFVFVRYNQQSKVTGVSGTVQLDQSGTLPFTQVSPQETTAPYSPPTPGPFK
ncbi:MAG: hypothetical protein EPN97_16920 [Alphaproteobacteria bacterium]|nr:MAG: hypothetical protein EPN97_16920 [Alphaproteobacteria bacterium]